MIGPLTWELCSRADQSVIATLDDRAAGGRVICQKNAARVASVPLDLEDPAGRLIVEGQTLLRVSCPQLTDPLFVGRISQTELTYNAEGDTAFQVSAVDPFAQLDKASVFVTGLPFSIGSPSAYYEFTGADQTDILWDLVNLVAANGTGVILGSFPGASVARTISFPAGSSVGDGIRALAAMDAGAEWELAPVFGTDGRIAEFNIYYPRQGSDKSGTIILRLGMATDPGDEDELTQASYAPSIAGMINRYVVIGEQDNITNKGGLDYPMHTAYRADHFASISEFGVWEASESMAGTTDPAILQAHAAAVVAANAMPTGQFSASLDPDVAPDFGPGLDFFMGDTIAVQIGLPDGTLLPLSGRVSVGSWTETASGDVHVDVTCDPDYSSGVSLSAFNVVMDAGEGTVPPPPPPPPDPVADPCAPASAEPDPCGGSKDDSPAQKAKKKKKKK